MGRTSFGPNPLVNADHLPSFAKDPLLSDSDQDEPQKPFRVQRRRLGKIRLYKEEGEFGFIEAEDFREDVFFHRRAWEDGHEGERTRLREPEVGMWVEFVIDDELFATEQKLRAKLIRITERPEGAKLSGKDATFNVNTRHPKARRKRPTWRK